MQIFVIVLIKNNIMKKIIIFSMTFNIMVACDREKIVNNIDNDEHFIFSVFVQKSTDNSILKNYNLCFIQTTWTNNTTFKDSIMFTTITDENGTAKFKINSKVIKNKANVFYYIAQYHQYESNLPDSCKNELKYSNDAEVYHDGIANYYSIINASPNCELKYEILKTVSIEKNIDTLFVSNISVSSSEHKIPKYILISEDVYYTYFKADCSNTNTLKYYYYSNGIRSIDYFKEVFVPFSSKGLTQKTCSLDFK